MVITADTLFDFDKSTLTSDAEETLKLIGPKVQGLGRHPVKVEGHTDWVGSDEYNQRLSEKRAEQVKNWLMGNRFVEPALIQTQGFGEKHPVAPNSKPDGSDNPAGRQLNRRVEIVVDTCTQAPSQTSEAGSESTTKTEPPAAVEPPPQDKPQD